VKRRVFSILVSLLATLAAHNLRADSTWVYSVQVSASVQAAPPKITLNWQPDQYGANSYTLYRKAATDNSWGGAVTLSGTTTSYVDHGLKNGTTYYYTITAVGPGGESVWSAEVSAMPKVH